MAVHVPHTAVLARQLWFTGARQVEIREQPLPVPRPGEILVRNLCSAVSAGTELLVYRGQLPEDMPLDASLEALQGRAVYPLQYGYASVGRVERAGAGAASSWEGQLVFAFQPHASHFVAAADSVILVPDGIEPEAAVFLANMETAVNLVQDACPVLGERVVVLGQGIVGLLLANLLAGFPLARLDVVDSIELRRARALQLGAQAAWDPASEVELAALRQQLAMGAGSPGADLILEVSGAPAALDLAIELSGFASRIVIGSWYGSKTASLALGGPAHRNRLRISTSQVSTIAPELGGRWNKARRFALAWHTIRQLRPQALVSHRVPLSDAGDFYKKLHQAPDDILQALLAYD